MQRRAWGRWVRRAVIGAWLAAGCASSDENADVGFLPREYILAGQTGSLVPSCGVAPLSQEQLAVPVGDALAVFYASGCPEVNAAALSLVGPDARALPVRLEPLGTSSVYLVRVDESLSAGDYQLELPDGASSTLSVAEEAASLPLRLGSISARPQSNPCGEDVSFEWVLDADVRAHAPLLRVWVRVDGGQEQLWIDYGALQLDEDTEVAPLRLPRCSSLGCLLEGEHRLQVRAEIAGEPTELEPLATSFELACEGAQTLGVPSSDYGSSEGCSLGLARRPNASVFLLLGGALALRRWLRRRVAALPRSERSS